MKRLEKREEKKAQSEKRGMVWRKPSGPIKQIPLKFKAESCIEILRNVKKPLITPDINIKIYVRYINISGQNGCLKLASTCHPMQI